MESDIETRENMLSHNRNTGIASGSAGTSVMKKVVKTKNPNSESNLHPSREVYA